jgi:release factor glutamine methyltransferase
LQGQVKRWRDDVDLIGSEIVEIEGILTKEQPKLGMIGPGWECGILSVDLAPDVERFDLARALDLYRPSEHTAALLQVLLERPELVNGACVAEIGCGSGVILAALAGLGAGSLCGVDIDPAAMVMGPELMARSGTGLRAEFRLGDVWAPLAGRRFDLVVCNPPQFPTEAMTFPGRPSSWSFGGPDGRRVLDTFLMGLAAHLAPCGRAVITHNGFVDVARTERLLAGVGLGLRILRTTMLALPSDKRALMSRDVLRREEGRSLHNVGPYCFAQMHVVEIAALPCA